MLKVLPLRFPASITAATISDYSPEEVAFYQSDASPYNTAESDNFDKYGLFIERSLCLVGSASRVGLIVPHKFMTTTAGEAVRTVIAGGSFLEQLVHFGAQQVFGNSASNYTCILVLNKNRPKEFELEQVRDLPSWRYGKQGERTMIPSSRLGKEPWGMGSSDAQAVFERMKMKWKKKLGDVADIFVGVQTSADEIYIIEPTRETKNEVIVAWNGRDWPIEQLDRHEYLRGRYIVIPNVSEGGTSTLLRSWRKSFLKRELHTLRFSVTGNCKRMLPMMKN